MVKRLTFFAALILSLTSFVGAPAKGNEIVEIRLHGHYFSAPANVQITIALEPAANQRALIVEADGEHYFRSSALMLEGANEKRLHSVEFKSLPAGSYTLRARVMSARDVLATATQELLVTGTAPDK